MIGISFQDFENQFNKEYDLLYEHNDQVAGFKEAVGAFDDFVQKDEHACFVREFVDCRGDFISSDREAAAFMFALAELHGLD